MCYQKELKNYLYYAQLSSLHLRHRKEKQRNENFSILINTSVLNSWAGELGSFSKVFLNAEWYHIWIICLIITFAIILYFVLKVWTTLYLIQCESSE